ncbi:MAG: cytochrome c oxidase assembly protein [Caldilineaceae bacterium]|nr:cytochrome c oxidase assembly protein [Caldilineaceae bacterium]
MHPLWKALFSPWELRWEVIVPLAVMGILYGAGWLRLHRGLGRRKLASRWRLLAYYVGLFSIALALLSPVDWLGTQLLLMHMVQHKLLVMIAAPLVWLGNPFPVAMWALPLQARRAAATLLNQGSVVRRSLAPVAAPVICWLIFVFIYVGWHDQMMYNLALRLEWVHNLEHLTFFLGAMLFWWPVINSPPRLHRSLPYVARIVYVLAFVPVNAITGFAIANAADVIYTHYLTVPRLFGLSPLEDQAWGGALMWVWASQMMIMTAVIMLGAMLRDHKTRAASRSIHPNPHLVGRQQSAPR